VFWTWFCTVRWESTSRSATCRAVIPLATSRRTSISRSVSRGESSGAPEAMRRNSPSTSPASPGENTASPRAVFSTAASSSSRPADFTR
jgi:hypothetical protein